MKIPNPLWMLPIFVGLICCWAYISFVPRI